MFTTDILETYEASDVFDAVCAIDVGTNLTASHLLLQACEQTGVSVEESILVGDSTIEAKGAEEIGMTSSLCYTAGALKPRKKPKITNASAQCHLRQKSLKKSWHSDYGDACKTVHK